MVAYIGRTKSASIEEISPSIDENTLAKFLCEIIDAIEEYVEFSNLPINNTNIDDPFLFTKPYEEPDFFGDMITITTTTSIPNMGGKTQL